LKTILSTYKDLNAIFENNGINAAFFQNVTESLTDEGLLAEAVRYHLVTKQGGLKIRSISDLKRYAQIKYMFSEYVPL